MGQARLLSAALIFAALYACGESDSGQAGNDEGGVPEGGTPGDGSSGGIVDAEAGTPAPTPAQFGLDSRPSNTTCVAHARPVLDTPVTLEQVWKGITFNGPIHMKQAPGDDANWYVLERGGTLRTFPSTATSNADIKTLFTVTVDQAGEGGLLGFAFPPDWKTSNLVYVDYTRDAVNGDPPVQTRCGVTSPAFIEIIARLTSSGAGGVYGPPDEIFKVAKPYSNHNGGNLNFGPDGMLYAAFGDGGSGNDPCGNGQQLDTYLAKFIRIDVNAPAGTYNIPPDNPFLNTPGAMKEIWTYGHRNPWRWSFDSATGDLWEGEVGQDTWEEVNHVQKGGNYGWSLCEGFHPRGNADPNSKCNQPGTIDPILDYGRSDGQCIIGGYVYRGTAIPSLVGTYLYADYGSGNLWALKYDANNNPAPEILITGQPGFVSFAQGNDGEVYVINLGNSQIFKLVANGTPPPDTFPQLLSQSGCVDPNDATKPAAGVIPYNVISPLWSDGAQKQRFMGIPDGKTIGVGTDNDWDLPVGSVVMKTFSVAGKRVETRLFMHHDDGAADGGGGTDAGGIGSGWAGYSYRWNDAQTDATLLPAGDTEVVGTQTWSFPSRSQCLQCHSQAAGGTIGLETWQLNEDEVYPSTNRISNQLATLDHIGMFTTSFSAPPDQLPKLPDPGGTDPLDARARSYLHANCSHCHRPSGGGQGTMDLRYGESFHDTQTCNADPTQGQFEGVTDGKILLPGNPAKSVLSLRVHATDSKRMPPVAVSILDPLGSKLIDDWITSVTTCP